MTVINSSAPIILESAQTGYYVNRAYALSKHILSTKDVTDAQKTVWQYLFDQAHLDKNLSCQATRAQIAKGSGKKESSIYRMLKSLEQKDYLIIRSAKADDGSSINTYFLTLPNYALEIIKKAPKRGDRRESIENLASALQVSAVNEDEKLSTCKEQGFADSSNIVQKELLEISGGAVSEQQEGCSRAAGGLLTNSVRAVPDQPLILNNNINKKNNNTKPPAVDKSKSSPQSKPTNANALLNKFYGFLDEVIRDDPKLNARRRSVAALNKFEEAHDEKEIKQLHDLFKAEHEPQRLSVESSEKKASSPNESKPVKANSSVLEKDTAAKPIQQYQATQASQPTQQSHSTLAKETKGAKAHSSMDMVEIRLQEEKFLIEKSVQSTVISGITQAYNSGRIKGKAAEKSLSDLIKEVLFYVCTGNKDKSQREKGKAAIYICLNGTWGTPNNYYNHAIQKREMASKQAKSEEIRLSKQLFKKMGF